MSRLSEGLGAIARRGHLDEGRLDQLAADGLAATTTELMHLRSCRRCRSLLVGFRRTAAVLDGAWAERPLQRRVEIAAGGSRVRLRPPSRPAPGESRGFARRAAVPVAMAAILLGVVATAGLLTLRGGGQPASSVPGSSMAGATPQGTPQRTGLVARLPGAFFTWAPDGQHLLLDNRVYDRFGNLVSTFGQSEGWLDATHIISGDGHVASIDEPYTGGPTSNSWVVASGDGSAAIIVAVPGCIGDPTIDWYKNGGYVRAGEKATPYGWSPDGKLLLLGHMDCSDADAQLHGWKGRVDVIDFASGRVLATAPSVRGEMAFSPSATMLAAQSDADLEIVTIAGSKVQTIPGARFLSWLDDDHLYYKAGADVEMLVLRSGASASAPAPNSEWAVTSPAGPHLMLDATGTARRIVSADWTTTLLDLSATSLSVFANPAADQMISTVQDGLWSPDGRMLAVASSDGTSLALFSVTDLPGSVASALPTPIGSPQAISELDRATLPGPVRQLVPDAGRDAFWFLGGESGQPIDLYRYDVATAKLSSSPVGGTSYDKTRNRLAIGPDGRLWMGSGLDLIVYDPDTAAHTVLTLPASGPDVQNDPGLGKPDPWIAGIAFDAKNGVALVSRNWVRSLVRIDSSLHVIGSVDVSDGFAMTGGIVFAGGRVFVVADPETGFGFGVDATGTQTLSNLKFTAPSIAEWGDRLLTAGTPPGWIGSDGGGGALIEPVPASADLVASGPNGVAALYSAAAGEIQWRDAEGKVSGQGVFTARAAPLQITALACDGWGRPWAVELAGSDYSLVRLSLGV